MLATTLLAASLTADPAPTDRYTAWFQRIDPNSDGIPVLLQDAAAGAAIRSDRSAAALTDDPLIQADASPVRRAGEDHAGEDAAFLICHTSRQASTLQSMALARALTDAGAAAKVVASPSDTHAAINHRIGEKNHPPTTALVAFLDAQHPTRGMAWIPAGTYTAGAEPRTMPMQRPAHQVSTPGFWIDETEVTNDQFAAFVKATDYVTTAERPVDWTVLASQLPAGTPKPPDEQLAPGSAVFTPPSRPVDLRDFHGWWTWTPGTNWRHPEGPSSSIEGRGDHPVVHVSWDDATAYAKWAGKRLPTENEWERAARLGRDGAMFTWGDEARPGGAHMANIWQGPFPHGNTADDGHRSTAPARSFPSNAAGLFDMAGNVWEWTSDGHGQHERVQKGGSFLCHDSYCGAYRPSARATSTPDSSFPHVGFRCVTDAVTPGSPPSAPE